MIIRHNVNALNTLNSFNKANNKKSKAMEKLSSGLRINRAADDAAGLAISEKMRAQIRGLNQAERNIKDGISLIQTAEGALNETHSILQRMRELCVQAANDTLTKDDREKIQDEINQLKKGVDDIANNTEFNEIKLLNGGKNSNTNTNNISNFDLEIKNSNTTAHLNYIVWNGDTYVAVGDEGKVVTSKDGEQWHEQDLGINLNFYTVAWNGECFVTVAQDYKTDKNYIFMSKDGVNWNNILNDRLITPSPDNTVYDIDIVKSDGEKFYAIQTGVTNFVYESKDGINWSFKRSDSSHVIGYYTKWDGNTFISVGHSDTFKKFKNFDNINWSKMGGVDSEQEYNGIASNGKVYVAFGKKIGQDPINNSWSVLENSLVKISTDEGNTWSTILLDKKNVMIDVIWNGEKFVGVSHEKIFTSIDGVDWKEEAFNSNHKMQGIVWENNKYIAIGKNGQILGNKSSETYMKHIYLQTGSNSENTFKISLSDVRTSSIGIDNIDILSINNAQNAITSVNDAIYKVSSERSKIGAYQNALEHTLNNVSNYKENLTASESRIRDADMAKEIMKLTKQGILEQTSQALLKQANQQPNRILELLT